MGKVVKVDLEANKNENQEDTKMEETKQEIKVDAQELAQGAQIQLIPAKNQKKKGLLDIIWKDRGIFGKAVTVTVGSVTITGLVIAVKALVAMLFGPEAAEAIDPEMVAPEE